MFGSVLKRILSFCLPKIIELGTESGWVNRVDSTASLLQIFILKLSTLGHVNIFSLFHPWNGSHLFDIVLDFFWGRCWSTKVTSERVVRLQVFL